MRAWQAVQTSRPGAHIYCCPISYRTRTASFNVRGEGSTGRRCAGRIGRQRASSARNSQAQAARNPWCCPVFRRVGFQKRFRSWRAEAQPTFHRRALGRFPSAPLPPPAAIDLPIPVDDPAPLYRGDTPFPPPSPRVKRPPPLGLDLGSAGVFFVPHKVMTKDAREGRR